jgi:hypothetical protein
MSVSIRSATAYSRRTRSGGRGSYRGSAPPATDRTPADRHKAKIWAQRLARVFRIDVTRCESCGGPVRIIASLTNPGVLDRILVARTGAELPGPARGPPQGERALG